MQTAAAQTDVLGAPYRRRVIELPDDDEGPVVATLVSRPAATPVGRAVLYLHGFNDYFFQAHLADWFVARGHHFYALDLRKYGRSLLPHQTPNFARGMAEYFPELDEAVRVVRAEDGHGQVLLFAHSTGGLIGSLWANARPGVVDGAVLNSPFLDLNAPWLLRRPGADVISRLAGLQPYRPLPLPARGYYGRSIHRLHDGEWDFDTAWKPLVGLPVRAGWLAGIRRAQRRVHAGLDIDVPILVGHSSATFRGREWSDLVHESDAVLDVTQIARWAPALGRHVTVARIDRGRHDLTLSRQPAREEFFTRLDRWLTAYAD